MRRLAISEVRDLMFGRHYGRNFEGFDSDFVVVHGPNESGKSTLAEFLTWAIGGPWRAAANNTEAFRGGGDGKLGGRLLGKLGDDQIELQANFELKQQGTPRDKRSGYVGAVEVDAAKFRKILGDIDPADFELIYRCYGATLGDIGSGGLFEKLFDRFAMGGSFGVRNPREALEGLRKATKSANDIVGSLAKDIRVIEKEIIDARANPQIVAELKAERDRINERITVLDAELIANTRREGLLLRVINGQGHRDKLNQAKDQLANIPAVSPEWVLLVDNASVIADLAGNITSAAQTVDQAQTDLRSAAAAAGMEVTLLEGRTLSAPERLRITTVTDKLLKVRQDAADARHQLSDLEDQISRAKTAAANLCRNIGLTDAGLTRLDAVESQLAELSNRAVRWAEDINKVIDAEAQVAGEIERRKTDDGRPSPATSSRSIDPKLVAAAVVAVAVASVVHWSAAIVLALGAAAYFMLGRAGTSAVEESDRGPVVDNATLANLRSRATEYRESAELHRRILDEGLGVLATLVTTVDLAPKQLQQLVDLATWRRKVRDLEDQVAELVQNVAQLDLVVAETERAVSELLQPRGISIGMVNSAFNEWLTKYEEAVDASASLVELNDRLTHFRNRLSELTAPVASEVDGLTPLAIASRVDEAKLALSKHRAAMDAVGQAEAQVRAANLDSPEVHEIMALYLDSAELQVQLETVQLLVTDIRGERDSLNQRLGEIRVEIDSLEGIEVLPGLLLRKGNLEDAKDEAKVRHSTLSTAHELLAAAIDEHERANQDPVVALASALVAEVVPDWGSVIKTRSEGGKMLIQRVGVDGRIGDNAISDGGRALLYLAVRLAFAQQDAAQRQIALPIICDDPLIHFDDLRQQAAVQLLKKVSANHQVMLFTCDRRTRDYAASLGASIIEM